MKALIGLILVIIIMAFSGCGDDAETPPDGMVDGRGIQEASVDSGTDASVNDAVLPDMAADSMPVDMSHDVGKD